MIEDFFTHPVESAVALSGASLRNVKYWTERHQIPTRKRGRRIYYDERGIALLRLARAATATGILGGRYLDWIADEVWNRSDRDPDLRLAFAEALAPLGLADLARPRPRNPA